MENKIRKTMKKKSNKAGNMKTGIFQTKYRPHNFDAIKGHERIEQK